MSERICSVETCPDPVGKHGARGYCPGHYKRVMATGDPQADIPFSRGRRKYASDICAAEDCDEPRWARGWCSGHLARWRATGDVQADKPLIRNARGEQSAEWKGDAITSPGTMHDRLQRVRGKASDHSCVDCGVTGHDWSHRNDCPDERITGEQHWCIHVECYEPRCRRCHWRYDEERAQRRERRRAVRPGRPKQDQCTRGHLLSGDNLYVSPKGERVCRKCAQIRRERYVANQKVSAELLSRNADPTPEDPRR